MNAHSEKAAAAKDEQAVSRHGVEQPLMIAFLMLALIPLTGIMYAQYAVSRVKAPLDQVSATSFEFGLLDREYRSDAREASAIFTDQARFESPQAFEEVERQVAAIGARMDERIEQIASLVDRKTGAQAMRMQKELAAMTQQSLGTTRQKLNAMARKSRLETVLDALINNLERRLAANGFGSGTADSADTADPNLLFSSTPTAIEVSSLLEALRQANETDRFVELAERRDAFLDALNELRGMAEKRDDSSHAGAAHRVFVEISSLAEGEDGFFATSEKVIRLREQETTEHAEARILRRQIINTLARSDKANQQATRDLLENAGDTLSSSMVGLLLFFIASVVGSLIVLHFYVRKQIVHRLTSLSNTIRRMNRGELDERVEIDGQDELTEIAAAIEKARLNTIQIQENERLLELRNQELEAANAELDKFAYVASHDLKSPLRAIQSLAEFLEEDLEDSLDEDSKRHFELLRGRVRRMSSLLDSLLEYSRVGRQDLDPEVFDLRRTIEECATLVTPASETVEISSEIGVVKTWKTPLEQVVRNLVDNAFKHSGGKGCAVSVNCTIRQSELRIVVSDNGPGIPVAYQEKIFEMFQTLKSRDEVEGSGMGLALLKKIADSFGATIEVVSDPDTSPGTQFVVAWPLAEMSAEEVEKFCRLAASDHSRNPKKLARDAENPDSRKTATA